MIDPLRFSRSVGEASPQRRGSDGPRTLRLYKEAKKRGGEEGEGGAGAENQNKEGRTEACLQPPQLGRLQHKNSK